MAPEGQGFWFILRYGRVQSYVRWGPEPEEWQCRPPCRHLTHLIWALDPTYRLTGEPWLGRFSEVDRPSPLMQRNGAALPSPDVG